MTIFQLSYKYFQDRTKIQVTLKFTKCCSS